MKAKLFEGKIKKNKKNGRETSKNSTLGMTENNFWNQTDAGSVDFSNKVVLFLFMRKKYDFIVYKFRNIILHFV